MTDKETGAEGTRTASYLEQHYPHDLEEILLADGFDEAFIGVVEVFGISPRACYDISKCLDILMVRDSMSDDEAIEYMSTNVTQAYVGERTPAFMIPLEVNIGEDGTAKELKD